MWSGFHCDWIWYTGVNVNASRARRLAFPLRSFSSMKLFESECVDAVHDDARA